MGKVLDTVAAYTGQICCVLVCLIFIVSSFFSFWLWGRTSAHCCCCCCYRCYCYYSCCRCYLCTSVHTCKSTIVLTMYLSHTLFLSPSLSLPSSVLAQARRDDISNRSVPVVERCPGASFAFGAHESSRDEGSDEEDKGWGSQLGNLMRMPCFPDV